MRKITSLLMVMVGVAALGGEIHTAAGRANLETVKRLIQANPKLVNEPTINGVTPLMFAARTNTPAAKAVVEFLLANQADPNLTNKLGGTALQLAAMNQNPEVVEVLLKNGANVNYRSDMGNAANCALAKYGKTENIQRVLEVLIAYKVNLNEVDDNGLSVLDFAKRAGYTDIVAFLKKNGATKSRLP